LVYEIRRVIRLMREVRFFHQPPGAGRNAGSNHWSGTDSQSCPPFWVVRVVVEGPTDPQTGYVCDIKLLDDFVRAYVAPRLASVSAWTSFDSAVLVINDGFRLLADQMGPSLRLLSVQLRFSPFTFVTLHNGDSPMTLLTQSFEFSASHRLQCPSLTDEENHQLFGKCSNPHGHGHNYVLEVTVDVPPGETSSTLHVLDRSVRAEVIERFDHKNLNVECAEFEALNPTVENIAQVIFDRLADKLNTVRLDNVRVWETQKTYAECSSLTSVRART
jgi:6-pyruvoyltetrahydropterin/6-carboxytetrahydropterin synthase